MNKKTVLGKCITPNFNKLPLTEYYRSLPDHRNVIKGTLTPKLILLYAISDVTGKSHRSVRRWVSGAVTPTALERSVIASLLESEENVLFPENQ